MSQALSKNKEETVTKRYEYCEKAIKLNETLQGGSILLGEYLKNIRDKELFRDGWESWRDFLLELHMTESSASKLVTVFEKWVVMGGFSEKDLAPVGWSMLYDARGFVSRETLAELSVRQDKDARDYIRELKSGLKMDDCPHVITYTIKICKGCGHKEQVLEPAKNL